jgi:CRISP-associated protein Cas1
MSSLYVDRKGVELRADGEALAFYENNERVGTVPLAPLDRVFLRGDVYLHTSLLGKLGEHGIGVVVQSGRKGEASLLMAQPHNDAARRVAQYRLSQDEVFCRAFAESLIELKIRAQSTLLGLLCEKNLHARYELTVRMRQLGQFAEQITSQTSIAALRGLEGAAAASYFAGLAAYLPASLKFRGRNRRPPRDPFNAVLSLSYTLLHAEAVLALFGAGLDPFIGFYHALDFGRESLACDVIEPLRPVVDRFAIGLFAAGHLRPEDFSMRSEGCFMGKAARARFYPQYELLAEKLRKQLNEQIGDLIGILKMHGLPDTPQQRSPAVADEDFAEDLPASWLEIGEAPDEVSDDGVSDRL